jgi:predicted glycoside hydrolase/deacetylase ChbG (UPF0249 family)
VNKFLIINADDFGLTRSVCEGILEAHQHGVISSTTVLMNQKISKSIIKKAKSFKELGIGIHLNISSGGPLSSPRRIRTLINEKGQFNRINESNQKRISLAELECEWMKQINSFRKMWGRNPTHIDTHHHVHVFPRIWKVFFKIATRLRLPFRLPAKNAPKSIQERMRRKGVVLPQSIIGSLDPKHYWRVSKVKNVLCCLKPGIHEIVCHPGRNSAALQRVSSFNQNREKELSCFTSKSVIDLIGKENINLINYGYLKLK